MKNKGNAKGPLESLKLKDHCEMCGVSEHTLSKAARDKFLPLEPAFNPAGIPKTLCRDCRIGSAELIRGMWFKGIDRGKLNTAMVVASIRLFERREANMRLRQSR